MLNAKQLVGPTLLLASTAATAALTDFGATCTRDSDCQSGICSTSCSSYDLSPTNSTSCLCPCTDTIVNKTAAFGEFTIGPCCCGCVVNEGSRQIGDVQACPQLAPGWARGNLCEPASRPGCDWGEPEPSSDAIPCEYTYARMVNMRIANDGWTIPPGVVHKVDYTGPSATGTKLFGAACDHKDECASGICGTGCDCPSEALATCSCEALCNFPSKCCGGCIIGNETVARTCPVLTFAGVSNGIDYDARRTQAGGFAPYYAHRITMTTFDGPTPWMPTTAEQASYALCLLYQSTMSSVVTPALCDVVLASQPQNFTRADVAAALCEVRPLTPGAVAGIVLAGLFVPLLLVARAALARRDAQKRARTAVSV